jgi:urea transporter
MKWFQEMSQLGCLCSFLFGILICVGTLLVFGIYAGLLLLASIVLSFLVMMFLEIERETEDEYDQR